MGNWTKTLSESSKIEQKFDPKWCCAKGPRERLPGRHDRKWPDPWAIKVPCARKGGAVCQNVAAMKTWRSDPNSGRSAN